MAFAFLTNILNRAKRRSTQFGVQRKKRALERLREREQAGGRKFELLPFAKINPKLIIIPLLLLMFGALGFYVFNVAKSWIEFKTKPFPTEVTSLENSNPWKGEGKITILLVGTDQVDPDHAFIDALGIASLDVDEKDLAIFMINPDLKVYVSSLGKDVNFRTMLLDKNLKGDRMTILKNAVSALLAVKVDRYIVLDKNNLGNLAQEMNPVKIDLSTAVKDPDTSSLPAKHYVSWEKGTQVILASDFLAFMASDINGRDEQLQRQQNLLAAIPFSFNSWRSYLNLAQLIKKLGEAVYTDLSKDELFQVIYNTLQLRDTDVKRGYTRASSYSLVQSVSFYPVFVPDTTLIDKDINNIFFDLKIFKEQAKIEVLNASSIRGLANSRARWITNLGARILKIGNSYQTQTATKIYIEDPEKYPHTMRELTRIFNNKAEVVKGDYPNRHVGDIVIELGNVTD